MAPFDMVLTTSYVCKRSGGPDRRTRKRMKTDYINDPKILAQLYCVRFILLFNAAQPGVGRVQVLGSKSLEEADYLAIKSLEVDRRVPAGRVF